MHGTIYFGCSVEIRPLAEVAAVADAVRALAGRALVPNVFYEPAFIGPAAKQFGHDAKAGLVWCRRTSTLIGFYPVRIEQHRYGIRLPVLLGFVHAYGPLGMPLLDRERSAEAVAAWLDHIAAAPDLPKLLLMPYLPARGAAEFEAALARRAGRSRGFDRHVRALLRPGRERAGYLAAALSGRKRKELRRQRRRLAECGALVSETAHGPPLLGAALADFLALEASGWKGRAGTAAAADDGLRGFVERAVTSLAAEGKASVARLLRDGEAIAAIVALRSGDAAWCWKIAYDEAFARHSPGVQLLLDVTQGLLDDPRIAQADSCATPDHPMIDHVWRERLALSDQLMSVVPCRAAWFAGVCGLESARRRAITMARAIRNRLRRR